MTAPDKNHLAAVDAIEATLRAYLEPWLDAEAYGTPLGDQIATAAALAVRDAEAVWPHITREDHHG